MDTQSGSRMPNASRSDHRHGVCKAFPSYVDYASFRTYVKRSAGYAITADAAIGCPLAPALVADLNRYGSGAAFADAVLSAKRLARSGCVLRAAPVETHVQPTGLPQSARLPCRALVVGLRAWGCAAVVL